MNVVTMAHPGSDVLAAFGQGRLDETAMASVASHLNSCSICRSKVASTPADTFQGKVKQAKDAEAPTQTIVGFEETLNSIKPAAKAVSDLQSELANHPKYKINKELGRGGMGVVYQAIDKHVDRPVVIKVMNPRLLSDPAAQERFLQEAKSAAKLNHTNIAQLYQLDKVSDLHLLVFEFVDGVNLEQFVRMKGVPAIHLTAIFIRQAALGLQHAFEQGVMHRDIKPNNMMLTRKGQVKIIDFGLGKVAQAAHASSTGLTSQNAVMGTLDYMSPEQAKSAKTADIRSDLYSLGCTLFYLLTGRPPFVRDTQVEIIVAHQSDAPPPLSDFRSDVPADLEAIVMKLLAKSPQDRIQKPIELAQALVPFLKPSVTAKFASLPTEPEKVVISKAATRIEPDTKSDPLDQLKGLRSPSFPREKLRSFSWKSWQSITAIMLAVVVALVLLVGIIISVKTKNGTLLFENVPEDAKVFIDGDDVTLILKEQKFKISIKPGSKRISVKQAGVEVFGEQVELASGGEKPVVVKSDSKNVAKDGGKDGPLHEELQGATQTDLPASGPGRLGGTGGIGLPPVKGGIGGNSPFPATNREAVAASSGMWTIEDGLLKGKPGGKWEAKSLLLFGRNDWKDYDYSFEAMKLDGDGQPGGFGAVYRAHDSDNNHIWFYGSFKDAEWTHVIYKVNGNRINSGNSIIKRIPSVPCAKWHLVKVSVRRKEYECRINGVKVFNYSDDSIDSGKVGLVTGGSYECHFRNIKVTDPDGTILWEGLPQLAGAENTSNAKPAETADETLLRLVRNVSEKQKNLYLIVCTNSFDEKVLRCLRKPIEGLGTPDGKHPEAPNAPHGDIVLSKASSDTIARIESICKEHNDAIGMAQRQMSSAALAASVDSLIEAKILHELRGHTYQVTCLGFLPDGKSLVTSQDMEYGPGRLNISNNPIFYWSVSNGSQIARRQKQSYRTRSMDTHPDGIHIATFGGPSGRLDIQVWNLVTEKSVASFNDLKGGPVTIRFSKTGSVLSAFNIKSREYFCYNTATWALANKFIVDSPKDAGNNVDISCFALSHDHRIMAIGHLDGTIRFLYTSSGKEAFPAFKVISKEITSLCYSGKGDSIYAAEKDGTIHHIMIADKELVSIYKLHSDAVRCMTVSRTGRYLLSGGDDKTAILWDTKDNKAVARFKGHTDGVCAVAFSPREAVIATGGKDNSAIIWQVPSTPINISSNRKGDATEQSLNGFVPLFNGKDLTGWKNASGNPGSFEVRNGTLIGTGGSVGQGPTSLFTSRSDFQDYTLRMTVYHSDEHAGEVFLNTSSGGDRDFQGNSVMLGTTPKAIGESAYFGSITSTNINGNKVNQHDWIAKATANVSPPTGKWYKLEIQKYKESITVFVDGKTVVKCTLPENVQRKGQLRLIVWAQRKIAISSIEIREGASDTHNP